MPRQGPQRHVRERVDPSHEPHRDGGSREGGQALVIMASEHDRRPRRRRRWSSTAATPWPSSAGRRTPTDAAALAGAVVIAAEAWVATRRATPTFARRCPSAFTNNGGVMGTSYYVDYENSIVGTVGRGGSIPSEAAGVQAHRQPDVRHVPRRRRRHEHDDRRGRAPRRWPARCAASAQPTTAAA